MAPKISVIVPVYKAEQYLHRCVDSILSQSYTDFELILVDDGSPDKSGKICDEYAVKDIRVKVIHKENGGVSIARNVGIEHANGEWITFIDSDDYIEQGFLSIPEDSVEDMLIQNYTILRKDGPTEVKFEHGVIPFANLKNFINNKVVDLIFRVPWAKFFKRRIITSNNILFTDGVRIGEDTIFVLDYLRFVKSIQYVSNSKYVYKDEENVFTRYQLPVSKCTEIVKLFVERYDKLNLDSISFLKFTYIFFYKLIYPRNYADLLKWYSDETIVRLCKTFKYDYGIKWAFKYALHLIKKRILNFF